MSTADTTDARLRKPAMAMRGRNCRKAMLLLLILRASILMDTVSQVSLYFREIHANASGCHCTVVSIGENPC